MSATFSTRRIATSRAPSVATSADPETVARNWTRLQPFRPCETHLARHRIVTHAPGDASDGFDRLRAQLLRLAAAKGHRRIAVASPRASSGASTVALNLGFALARSGHDRVVSVEANLRTPSHAALAGIPPVKLSASYLLSGEARLADCAVGVSATLALASAAQPSPVAGDLMLDPAIPAAIAEIEADYAPRFILFDLPPLLDHADGLSLLSHVDCLLIVAAADHTTTTDLDTCERLAAEQTEVMGVVLNRVP